MQKVIHNQEINKYLLFDREFIDYIIELTGANVRDFHLIGFSAGAHVVGGAGAAVTSGRIPRISGLDPAHPFLTVNRTDNRLGNIRHDF